MPATTDRARDTDGSRPPRTGRRWAVRAAVGIVVTLLLGVLGVGWYYADEILGIEEPEPEIADVEILSVDSAGGVVELTKTADSVRPGVWGLQGPQWYAQVGPVVAEDVDSVSRSRTCLSRARSETIQRCTCPEGPRPG